jgi:hypothetical protein
MLQRRVLAGSARAEAGELFSPVKKSMISQWDQAVQRHAPRAEIAANNREFREELSRPRQYQCIGFQKCDWNRNNREFDG